LEGKAGVWGTLCSWEAAILATRAFVPFRGSEEPCGFVLTCTLRVLTLGAAILPCPERTVVVPCVTD